MFSWRKAMESFVNLGLIQMQCSEDMIANFAKTKLFIEKAANKGAQIVCTQELFKSRYFPIGQNPENFELAEIIDEENRSIIELARLADDLNIVVVASLFETAGYGLFFNTSVVIDADGRLIGKYRKMHIPQEPGFFEKFYFAPGDLGFKTFQTRYSKLGLLICYDQWFPEGVRVLALQGAEIIIIPTANGHTSRDLRINPRMHESWQIVQRGNSIANACYTVAINRVGIEKGENTAEDIHFWGRSFVSDPFGSIVAEASAEDEEILIASIDLRLVREARNRRAFFLRDRRIDAYDGILER
jgi:N-carbamoylputrescine amidase